MRLSFELDRGLAAEWKALELEGVLSAFYAGALPKAVALRVACDIAPLVKLLRAKVCGDSPYRSLWPSRLDAVLPETRLPTRWKKAMKVVEQMQGSELLGPLFVLHRAMNTPWALRSVLTQSYGFQPGRCLLLPWPLGPAQSWSRFRRQLDWVALPPHQVQLAVSAGLLFIEAVRAALVELASSSADADTVLMPRRVLAGRYRLGGLIGRGATSAVYRALDLETDVEVAVKLLELSPELNDDGAFEQRFHREGFYSRKLEHPNIVDILDSGTTSGTPFIVMELVEGRTLHRRLRQGALPREQCIALTLQIASALEAVHAEGLIHRDLKPGNVLLRESDGSAVLIDFGLCRSVDDVGVTRPGNIPGTTGYIAPEVIRSGELGPAADQYALGILLFGMRTGQHPFGRREAGRMLFAHLEERPPTLAQLGIEDPQLDAVIQRCLYKTPQARFASLAELREALEEKPVEPACPEEAANNPMRTVLLVALLFLSMGLLGMESL